MLILTVNAGSSSLRLVLYRRHADGIEQLHGIHCTEMPADAAAVLGEILDHAPDGIEAVAHRIVHGGDMAGPCRIDSAVEDEIERLAVLAPLHNPPALHWLRVIRAGLDPAIPHVAVFDTGFYRELPAVAAHYALPSGLDDAHELRRYGFHGSAHRAMWRAWCAQRPDLDAGGRIITLQLGAGCSATATDRGRAIDTSMGFTPLEGLMMATRCGDIDPGLLIHLQRSRGLDADALEELLTRNSGLGGVSGISADMRELLASDDPRAALAVDMFCYRVRKYIGAYIAVLGGVDGIVFGGGIGENSPEVRRRILAGLDTLGIVVDNRRNEAEGGGDVISGNEGRVDVRVIEVDEARELAEAISGMKEI